MSFLELKAPFVELRSLLNNYTPYQAEIINLAVGEPQHAPPPFIAAEINKSIDKGELSKYPPTRGTDELRASIGAWLQRRFNVTLDEDKNILPVCGTREALFLIGLLASHRKAGDRKFVFVPDPGYQCYTAAAFGSGCEVVFLSADKENNFLPDLELLEKNIKQHYKHNVSAFYLCSPANPQGQIADKNYLRKALQLAQKWDFVLITDECYAEIYDTEPAPSALEVAADDNFKNLITFHSLSKRSNLPGLRSGFCAGCEILIENFRIMRELGGVAMPLPSQAASSKAWSDDAHVAHNRELYKEKFDLAENYFGKLQDFYRPQGGFFLWLCLDEFGLSAIEMTKKLWQEAAISVLPGNFLSQQNKGENYIRLALVAEATKLESAFQRMLKVL